MNKNGNDYFCKHCHKRFTRKDNQRLHEKKCDKKTHTCDQCERNFIQKENLVKHINKSHSKLHHCQYCCKTFQRHVNKRLHENQCDEKPKRGGGVMQNPVFNETQQQPTQIEHFSNQTATTYHLDFNRDNRRNLWKRLQQLIEKNINLLLLENVSSISLR